MNLFLPPAKSILNRHLIAASWTPRFESFVQSAQDQFDFDLWAEDSLALLKALRSLLRGEKVFDFKEGAAPLRFFSARLALHLAQGEVATVNVGARLVDRALDDLAVMMRSLGVDFERQQLQLKFTKKTTHLASVIEAPFEQSSQFASALELNLWAQHSQVKVRVHGRLVSKSFYEMSVEIKNWWVRDSHLNQQLHHQWPQLAPDAASACAGLLYAMGPLGRGGQIAVDHLSLSQLAGQPDARFVGILESMGFQFHESSDGLSVSCPNQFQGGLTVDLSDCSDLAPVLAAFAASVGVFVIWGLPDHLNLKESRRKDLIKLLEHHIKENSGSRIFDTHGDHRMAMAVCVAQVWCDRPLKPSEVQSVAKSYPGFLRLHPKAGT